MNPCSQMLKAVACLMITWFCSSTLGKAAPAEASPTTISVDGFNLKIEKIEPARITVAPTVKGAAHNWFAGTFQNLPTDREITIAVNMKGNNTSGNPADVRKWQGLRPVMTYADPTNYETYVWYSKDANGRWMSSDPFLTGAARFAGTGATPEQAVISDTRAPEFLSEDKKLWMAWKDIKVATADTKANIFNIKYRFAAHTATVAMRIPFTYTLMQQILDRVQTAQVAGVTVDEVGVTPEKRSLQVVRLESLNSTAKANQQTVLVIAREHATEHAASWPVYGMLLKLLENSPEVRQLRANTTWMFLLIEDPDGSAHSRFERITEGFEDHSDPQTPPEVFLYAKYFRDYINSGHTIDVAISIHNVEAREAENISTPLGSEDYEDNTERFNRLLFDKLRTAGYTAGKPKPDLIGASPFRLYGWCAARFGTFDLALEVNDRYPSRHLALPQFQKMGALMAEHTGNWLASREGQQVHERIKSVLQQREQERAAYFAEWGLPEQQEGKIAKIERANYDLLVLGY